MQRRSLLPDPGRYQQLAARAGGVVRQIAECRERNGHVISTVEPVIVSATSQFASTRHEQNRIDVHTGWSAPLSASGPGAGGVPTANALICDLLAAKSSATRSSNGARTREDDDSHDWLIEILGSPADLHQFAQPCDIVRTDATASWSWTICRQFPRARIDAVIEALSARGGAPVAARLDDDVAEACR